MPRPLPSAFENVHMPPIPTPRWISFSRWEFVSELPTAERSGAESLMDEGRVDFSKNLRASLFNKGLSNEPNSGRIHLAGQYL